jgi:hypothetical protein
VTSQPGDPAPQQVARAAARHETLVRVIAGVVGTQGLVLALCGVVFVVAGVFGQPSNRSAAVFIALTALVWGGGLLAFSRGWLGRARWVYTPTLLSEMWFAIVGFLQAKDATGAPKAAFALLCLSAIAATVGCLNPGVVALFRGTETGDPGRP